MKTYRVQVVFELPVDVDVEADNQTEAEDLAVEQAMFDAVDTVLGGRGYSNVVSCYEVEDE